MYRFWRLDIQANSVHSSKFSNPRTSSFNKSLTAWVQMAIAPISLADQQLSQYLGIYLTAFLPRFQARSSANIINIYAATSAIVTYKKLRKLIRAQQCCAPPIFITPKFIKNGLMAACLVATEI